MQVVRLCGGPGPCSGGRPMQTTDQWSGLNSPRIDIEWCTVLELGPPLAARIPPELMASPAWVSMRTYRPGFSRARVVSWDAVPWKKLPVTTLPVWALKMTAVRAEFGFLLSWLR